MGWEGGKPEGLKGRPPGLGEAGEGMRVTSCSWRAGVEAGFAWFQPWSGSMWSRRQG